MSIKVDCSNDNCYIVSKGGISTCMAYIPAYDKNGNQIHGGDPNTYTEIFECYRCARRWSKTESGGTERVEELL